MSKQSSVIKQNLWVIIYIYLTMTYYGMIESLRGVALPLIKNDLDISYDLQGLLLTISGIGYVLSCMVATYVQTRVGPRTTFLCGFSLCIIGSLVVYFAYYYYIVMLGLFIICFGFGFYEITLNSLSTIVFYGLSAVFMNLLHFFFGVGSTIGPWFATLFVNVMNQSFRGPYLIIIIPTFILLIVALCMNFTVHRSNEEDEKNKDKSEKQETQSSSEPPPPTMTTIQCLQSKYVWLLSFTLGYMEVAELGAMNWGSLYLQDYYGMEVTVEGATFVSLFYVIFTISRLISGFWIDRMGLFNSLLFSTVMSIIILLIGFMCGPEAMYILPLSGFFLAIMWPTLMCYAMPIFKNDTPRATSMIITISGIVNQIMQYITGVINEYIGYVWGYRCNTVYLLIPIVTLSTCHCLYKKEIYSKDIKKDIEMQEVKQDNSVVSKEEEKDKQLETVVVQENTNEATPNIPTEKQ